MGPIRIEALDARRLLAAYAPDVSFGSDGVVPSSEFAYGGNTFVTLVQEDSRGLLVARSQGAYETSSLALERYTLDGRLDPDFTPRNISSTEYLAARPYGDRQGRMLLVSYTESGRFQVERYSADGTPDRSFGKRGAATTADVPPVGRGETSSYPGNVYGVEVTDGPDGSVYVTGYRTVYTARNEEVHQHFVYKLTAAGQIDTTFGTSGVLLAGVNTLFGPLSTSEDAEEFFFGVDPQNRLVVGQTIAFGQFTFTRYTAAGRLDTSYGDGGTFLYDVGPSGFSTLGFHAALDAQGRALLLAEVGAGSKVLRLDTNGRIDTAFGESGFASSRGYPQSLIVQDDGKLVAQVAAGAVYYWRLNPDGSRDATLGPDGLVRAVQTDNVPELLNYHYSFTVAKLMTQLADGSFVTLVDTRDGETFQKMAPAAAARRGTSGKLYLLGDDTADAVAVSQTSGGTRVVFNGRVTHFTKRITAIVTDLAGGDNRLDAPVDVPQTVSTAGGNDTILTGDADDTVTTRDGNDTIATHGGYDTIRFYGGDKTIDAGSGSGYVTGGPGGQTVAPAGRVRVVGTTTDGSTRGGWRVDVRGTRVSVTLGGGSAQIGVTAQQTAAVDVSNVVSRVSAAVSGKRVTFDARRATVSLNVAASVASSVTTGPGDDSIQGGRGADTIDGGAGDDRIYGNDGDDSIRGGAGDDLLVGGAGNDTLVGQAGNDRLYAGVPYRPVATAVNSLDGGDGDDRYLRESDQDLLAGLEGSPGGPT